MKKYFMIQKNMRAMLIAMTPLVLFSVFLFGWRVLAVLAITNISAVITEYLFVRKKKAGKISMAVFVSAFILTLSIPPTIPLWMAAVGSIVAITFGKMVFGGFGTNIFNPAMVGRTFIYVSFANAMTVNWLKPFTSLPGGFAVWQKLDHLTGATPMIVFRDSGAITPIKNSFFGLIAGSAGETSAFLIIIAAIYLLLTKTAKWQPMVSTLLSLTLFSFIFYGTNPLPFLLTGGAMFGIVFITTDPVSMPKEKTTIWIYGIMIGFLTVLIRKMSLFAEGFMFAVLITNSFTPIIEYGVNKMKKRGAKK